MRRSTGLFARLALIPVLVLVATLASSCASQAEGERCDLRNNSDKYGANDDCESGLKCVQMSKLNPAEDDPHVGICCPTSSSQASDVCSQSSYTPAPDGGTAAGGASGTGGASGAGGESAAGGASSGGASAGGASSGGASAGGASASGGAPDAGAGGASTGGVSSAGGADAGAVPDASGD